MRIQRIFWDLDADPEGNVQHIAEHSISVEEVEDVLYGAQEVVASESSGRPITFGETNTDKYIAVVFDVVLRFDGSVSAEHGIGRLKKHHMAEIKSTVELQMMRDLKKLFDPGNIMNPGHPLGTESRDS